MTTAKKKIFISHATEDAILVASLVDNILEKCLNLTISSDIFCTSYNDATAGLEGDTNKTIKEGLLEHVKDCSVFIAIITINYLHSQVCQNEIGAACVLKKKVYAFKYDKLDFTEESLITGSYLLQFNETDVRKLIIGIKSVLSLSTACEASSETSFIRNFIEEYRKFKLENPPEITRTANVIFEAFRSPWLFHKTHPLVIFGDRDFYNKISVAVSSKARSKIIWALHKSPLLVVSAYKDSSELLTSYDIEFAKFKVAKTRLVIFESKEEAKKYIECDLNYHKNLIKDITVNSHLTEEILKTRKENFENNVINNNGKLYFTTTDILNEKLRADKEIDDLFKEYQNQFKAEYLFKLDYEFGFIISEDIKNPEQIGFTSGFNSQSFLIGEDADWIKHIAFYSLQKPEISIQQIKTEHRYKLFADIVCQIKIASNLNQPKNWLLHNVIFEKADIDSLTT